MDNQKILIISGPTASGKSDLANKIAAKIPSVIINADSMQIYRELPILSSQPSKDDLSKTPHALYSIFAHNEISSVANWLELALKEINQAKEKNQLPIIVGGTGFYISSLVNGINKIPDIDDKIRQDCRNLFEEIGKENFIQKLSELGEDKEEIEVLDKQRLIRKMEVLKQTGKTLNWWQNHEKEPLFLSEDFIHLNLNPNREKLYQNCNLRFELMLKNGGIEEVENFMKKDPNDNFPACKTIGYFEIRDYLKGFLSKEEALNRSAQKTRNYAKRQLTWFRNQFEEKFEIEDYLKDFSEIEEILKI